MASDDQDGRLDRLITVLEAQANALSRLTNVLEAANKPRTAGSQSRMRRVALDKPIVVNDVVQAAVKRALAKAGR